MGKMILLVGAGGFVGSVARFLSQQLIARYYPSSFPWGTLAVNVVGCFIIGMVYAFGEKGNLLSPELRLLLATGFCGGFTTFSSFAYENVALMRDGELLYTFVYIAASVVIGLLAAYLGVLIVKSY
ncbi:MAG TPA: fluoride efflux transporter CrcB [Chitinophagaceae bacterium]|jgi:CrcB protein|nr:fluoride efflux transporter CrcB [Chitinophagaceae bacterium]